MTLDKYLLDQGITTRAFAASMGVPFHTVTKWRQRTRMPRREAISKISRATNGAVKVIDWYNPSDWFKPKEK